MMRAYLLGLAIAFPSIAAEPEDSHVKRLFKSDNYTVKWGKPEAIAPDVVLEIGNGNGHGFSLSWLRFQPGKDGVEVLSIVYGGDRKPYESKWPPDE